MVVGPPGDFLMLRNTDDFIAAIQEPAQDADDAQAGSRLAEQDEKAVEWSSPHSLEAGDAASRLSIPQSGPTNKAAALLPRLKRALPFGLDTEIVRNRTIQALQPEDLSRFAGQAGKRRTAQDAFEGVRRDGREATEYGQLAKKRYDDIVAPYENAVDGNRGLGRAQQNAQDTLDQYRTQQVADRTLIGAGAVAAGGGAMAHHEKQAVLGGLALAAGRGALTGGLSLGKMGLKGALTGGKVVGKAGLTTVKGLSKARSANIQSGGTMGALGRGARSLQTKGVGANSRVLNHLAKNKGPKSLAQSSPDIAMQGASLKMDYNAVKKL